MEMEEGAMKLPVLARAAESDVSVRDDKGTTRITMSLASEYGVERWFGEEVLSHEKGAIRLGRLERGAMPLLINHDYDRVIGMIDSGRIEKKRFIVEAHLFDGDPEAERAKRWLSGGLRNVSIGYRIHAMDEDKQANRFTATDWEPYEGSIVTVPADPTVGVGRANEQFEVRMVPRATSDDVSTTAQRAIGAVMSKDNAAAGVNAEENDDVAVIEVEDRPAAPVKLQGAEREKERIERIMKFCNQFKVDEKYQRAYIEEGFTIEQVNDDVMRVLEERGKANPQPLSKLGLGEKETKQYSIGRACVAALEGKWKDIAPMEGEMSRAIAQRLNKSTVEPHKFYVPFEVMQRKDINPAELAQRAGQPLLSRAQLMDVQLSSGAGGYLIGTDNISFIEALYNRSVALRMGARRMSGLVGNVTIPRQSASATATWLATDASSITDTGQTFQQVSLTPHNLGALTKASRQLIMQSQPAADGIIATDLANVVAVAADLAMIHGTNSGGQPQGLVGTSGVGSVATTNLGYAACLEFQTDVAAANVVPMNGGYVTTHSLAAVLMQKQRFTSTDTPLWQGNVWNGNLIGFPAMASNQITSGYMIFGDWSELIFAEWGVLEIDVNPYETFAAGIISIRAMYSMDVGVRRPAAFSVGSSLVA